MVQSLKNLKGPHYIAIHHQYIYTVRLGATAVYCTIYVRSLVPCQSFQCAGFNFTYVLMYMQCLSYVVIRHGRGLLRQMNDTLVLSRVCGM